MYLYFKVDPSDDSIIQVISSSKELRTYNTKATSSANGKPYLVPVTVVKPAYDLLTETLTGPVDSHDTVIGTRTYTVVPKTIEQQEADEDERADQLLRNAVKSIAFLQIQLINKLLNAGVIAPSDFTPEVRQEYQRLKAAVDRLAK